MEIIHSSAAPRSQLLASFPPEVTVKSFRVSDVNGDDDGFPDTNETIDLSLRLRNPARLPDQTNVVIELSTTDPKIDCIIPASATIPFMSAGSEAEVPTAFRVHVHPDADRAGSAVTCNTGTCSNFVEVPGGCSADSDCYRTALQEYSANIMVTIASDSHPAPIRSHTIALDLDLDSSHPSAATTTFAEGFEGGLGAFELMNIDDNKASNSLSNGYRCQYNDPDFPNSHTYGWSDAGRCYLGFASSQDPVNDWHVHRTTHPDGGRAFEGSRSLHYGKHTPGNPSLDTYGMSQLDAIRTKSDVNLAARVCQNDTAPNKRACNSATDCDAVGGGPCVSAGPELSFKHQISIADDRSVVVPDGQATDRAVLHAQSGTANVWQKLYPFENIHNIQAENLFRNCKFDPIDDGNDEDSYFDPTDPDRLYGPSSTCFPEFAFSYLGDTDDPFDPSNIGGASDGPGLAGSLGIGTWVESKFDLSRFRGRSIKIRFVLTSIKAGDVQTWRDYGMPQGPWDDGWYIDDIRVTQTLGATSPTVTVDDAENSGLVPGNTDGDARGDDCDCAPADPGAFAIPGEVTNLRLGDDKVTLSWESAAPLAGGDTVHDVLRGALGELPVGSGASETCLDSGIEIAATNDPETPFAGAGFWYLVRGRNVCASGAYGFQSDGTQNVSLACP